MTDSQDILRRVRGLIAAGQHRDQVPGLPGVELEGAGMFSGDRRIYTRGTDEYASAAERGLLDRLLPPPPSADRAAIEEAESLVGAPLPALLKDLYSVANGGFGPGYGLLGLQGGFTDDMHRTAVDILSEVATGNWPGMPAGLMPLCHWGCAIYSFVHCPSGRIFGWDPNPVEPDDDVPFFEQEYLLDDWIDSWLVGSLQQPWLIYNPESGTYRGATIEETRSALAAGWE
ncbi:SMI1/KNR4 family protein [Actinopolymorpha sp. B17G11]|uniref:SMI1/KNR4 family protein n=1 Tax=Actinopolymorpha sp. B17G11 TaxID=3160861 RepID=UPI0032E4961D